MNELVYASSPARLGEKKKEIMDFVASTGKGPLHPFNAYPYEYFEGGVIGRKNTLEMCCRLIDVSDEFWLFGISEGTMTETEYLFHLNETLKSPKELKVYVKEFDPEWEIYHNLLLSRFPEVLKRLCLTT